MTTKVIYFTAGVEPTVDEAAEIAKLNAASVGSYEVLVMNGAKDALYGETRLAPCDLVAGTIPTAYAGKTELDPDLKQVVLTNGEDLDEAGGGTIAVYITAGVVTYTFEPAATQAVVENGDTLAEAGGGTIAVSITAGVATYTYTPGT